jgi:hypothetical protein
VALLFHSPLVSDAFGHSYMVNAPRGFLYFHFGEQI